MNIEQESVSDFRVGHGGADASKKPLVAAEFASKALKGVRVRAASWVSSRLPTISDVSPAICAGVNATI